MPQITWPSNWLAAAPSIKNVVYDQTCSLNDWLQQLRPSIAVNHHHNIMIGCSTFSHIQLGGSVTTWLAAAPSTVNQYQRNTTWSAAAPTTVNQWTRQTHDWLQHLQSGLTIETIQHTHDWLQHSNGRRPSRWVEVLLPSTSLCQLYIQQQQQQQQQHCIPPTWLGCSTTTTTTTKNKQNKGLAATTTTTNKQPWHAYMIGCSPTGAGECQPIVAHDAIRRCILDCPLFSNTPINSH